LLLHIPDTVNKINEYKIIESGPVVDCYWGELHGVFDDNQEKFYFRGGFGEVMLYRSGWYDIKSGELWRYFPFDALYDKRPFAKNDVVYGLDGKRLHKNTIITSESSSQPLLVITKTGETHEKLDEFKKSSLIQRFDNNTWFASGNNVFHTQYNDPTYITASGYKEVGKDTEPITGLSIVNDNVLAAYKNNRVYIITPIVAYETDEYLYTETKNVIGNDVPGAPILTILTEMPTIVSYDGIYALNQLENVQSSDRITTLISESINPLWLKERKADVDGCITLNRLYWTYYILPHQKLTGEKNVYTKIYLLDNRTHQWFLWTLPIFVTEAMVKDNKTHLVDASGQIFTLETTDLVGNRPEETEYYDTIYGTKQIIPWHWFSQILSLNTINYSKKLIDTTFILTDTDTQDKYGLDYKFVAWRKAVSETNETTITSNISYVQSTTKRTMIPRFNFIQLKLSNTQGDLDNNKLKLVGLGLKYVLLEGLY
jgi:hypothetical protein